MSARLKHASALACLFAATTFAGSTLAQTPDAARAPPGELKIVSAKNGAGTKFVMPATKQVVHVKTTATVPAGMETQIGSLALVNESTCTFDGKGHWTVRRAPKNGTISTGTVTAMGLADGKCPTTTFTFATILYTSTSPTAKADTLVANWSQTYQGVTYITNDSFRLTIKH